MALTLLSEVCRMVVVRCGPGQGLLLTTAGAARSGQVDDQQRFSDLLRNASEGLLQEARYPRNAAPLPHRIARSGVVDWPDRSPARTGIPHRPRPTTPWPMSLLIAGGSHAIWRCS